VSATDLPDILIIDDREEDGEALKLLIGPAAEVVVKTPDSFRKKDLEQADLVLVDYELNEWKGATASLSAPPNGLALSVVVREQIGKLRRGNVTAVALYTGQVKKISGTLPAGLRRFAVARLNNLEWIFEKGNAEAATGVVSLAQAVRRLPRPWPNDAIGASRHLHQLLSLDPECPFQVSAADDIADCHPPIHELSDITHALVVIRWLAHRILPYPTFLTDHFGLAARLRIAPSELDRLLASNSEFARAMESVAYRGVLCDLYGQHWWRRGLDDLALQWTGGAGGIDALHAAIDGLAGEKVKVKFLSHEVVPAVNDSYRPAKLVAVTDALRLRLDDWPPFAEDAWGSRSQVSESDRLRGLVLPTDTELLGAR
jgi:hypothetical protein